MISIHAPHARSDDDLVAVQLEIGEFQSTLLMRGATWPGPCKSQRHCISIHAPHARSDCARSGAARCWDISIHAPHARSDARRDGSIVHDLYFNPRSSCEERPHDDIDFANRADFNPRSSCEERPSGGTRSTTHFQFQSTLLMRGATDHVDPEDKALLFQSTLLMRGATCRWDSARHPNDYFNPRSSCEERHDRIQREGILHIISIHAPHARSDVM